MSMKFCDLDPIPTWLFMTCEEEIMPLLLHIVNGALDSGNSLKALKIALVKLNLKKENLDSDLFGNYSPVSNIAFMSKVLENCVLLQIPVHLDKNNIYGMKTNQLTENSIMTRHNFWLYQVKRLQM